MREQFFALLRNSLLPVLKAAGFTGNLQRARRRRDPFWDVVEIQRSSDGDACYVNLGVHLDFVATDSVVRKVSFSALKEAQCILRQRLERDSKHDDWLYGKTEAQAAAGVTKLVLTYQRRGAPWFTQFDSLPGPFKGVTPSAASFERVTDLGLWGTELRQAYILARIFEYCEDLARARKFAEQCLGDVYFGKGAKALIKRSDARALL